MLRDKIGKNLVIVKDAKIGKSLSPKSVDKTVVEVRQDLKGVKCPNKNMVENAKP